jgi:hypothetical protein
MLTESDMEENLIIALMMEAVSTCETSVHFNGTTRRYIPEDSKLQTRSAFLDTLCSRNSWPQVDFTHIGLWCPLVHAGAE